MNDINKYIDEIAKKFPNNIKNNIIKKKVKQYFKNKKIDFSDAKKEIDGFINKKIINQETKKTEKIFTAEEELIQINKKLDNLNKELANFYKKNTE